MNVGAAVLGSLQSKQKGVWSRELNWHSFISAVLLYVCLFRSKFIEFSGTFHWIHLLNSLRLQTHIQETEYSGNYIQETEYRCAA